MSENREHTVTELREMLEGLYWEVLLVTGTDPSIETSPVWVHPISKVVFSIRTGLLFGKSVLTIIAEGKFVVIYHFPRLDLVLHENNALKSKLDPTNPTSGHDPVIGLPWSYGDRIDLRKQLIISPREISTQRRLVWALDKMREA